MGGCLSNCFRGTKRSEYVAINDTGAKQDQDTKAGVSNHTAQTGTARTPQVESKAAPRDVTRADVKSHLHAVQAAPAAVARNDQPFRAAMAGAGAKGHNGAARMAVAGGRGQHPGLQHPPVSRPPPRGQHRQYSAQEQPGRGRGREAAAIGVPGARVGGMRDIGGLRPGAGVALPTPTDGFVVKYEIREVLGVGSTSTCYRCVERRTGRMFACKVIDKRAIEQKFKGLLEQFQVEVDVLKSLNHPNIIHMEDVFENDANIHMVMELMQGGELFDYVVEKGTLTEEEASVMVRKVTSALAYMHSLDIIHRDLKPENLLLTKKGDNAEVKIIDFGLSKIVSGDMAAKSFLGTRGYLAPEMLQRQSYSKAVDVWALGVIVFVLLCGCLPFDDDSSRLNRASALQKFVLRFPKWAQNLSPGAKDLLRCLLDVNPTSRVTAAQALEHPWVRGEAAKASNYLESPRALRQLPKLGTPKDADVAPTYGGGQRQMSTSRRDSRQANFKEQNQDLRGRGMDHPLPRKLSI